jgi:transposase
MEAHKAEVRQRAYDMWQSGEKKSVISRTLQVDYDTLLGWIKRFKTEGTDGLALRYSQCGRHAKTDMRVYNRAIEYRQAHGGWGCSYIRLKLVAEFGESAVASVRQIQRWIKAKGLIPSTTRLPAVDSPWADKALKRVQVDANEQLECSDGQKCCYLNFTDEHSGAVLDAFVFPPRTD